MTGACRLSPLLPQPAGSAGTRSPAASEGAAGCIPAGAAWRRTWTTVAMVSSVKPAEAVKKGLKALGVY